MAERLFDRARVAALLAAVSLIGACIGPLDFGATPSASRLLDESCGEGACTTTGNARATSGPTADSVGFRLARGGASVTIPLASVSRAGDTEFTIEVLASGAGALRARGLSGCCEGGSDVVVGIPASYEWVSVGAGSVAADSAGTFSGIVVQLATAADSEAEIADIRLRTHESYASCSVAAPGRRGWP
jgi:hypothetical protein